ncbi:MAG: hypothetical protein WCF18_09420 [Chthoniobacteraceae bacterium]
MAQPWFGAQLRGNLKSAEAWHEDVEENQIGMEYAGSGRCDQRIGLRLDGVEPGVFEKAHKVKADGSIVIDYENASFQALQHERD